MKLMIALSIGLWAFLVAFNISEPMQAFARQMASDTQETIALALSTPGAATSCSVSKLHTQAR